MKILKIRFSYLRNEAHYQYLLLVKKLFGAYPAVAAIVAALLLRFNELLTVEGTLVDAVRTSEHTEELVEIDRHIDRNLVGINSIIIAALHHYDEKMVKAARSLETRMKAFRGEIEKKSYEEESAAVKILVADLMGAYSAQVATLALNGWVADLASAQELFEQIFIIRNAELANRPQERLTDVRREIDGVYRQMVERIDAFSIIDDASVCAAFVEELNYQVLYFNEHTHHRPKTDIKNATVASIADQTYAGEPVIVLPEVVLEGKKLVFTRDYELSYRHNDRPGTATVTIHGKGNYKGRITVSFNIVENPEFETEN
jgi:hypothetical protein